MSKKLKMADVLDTVKSVWRPSDYEQQQPVHQSPDGVPFIKDDDMQAKRRVDSGYVELPEMQNVPEDQPIIRCMTCPWYRKEDAWCFYPKNDFQCNAMIGCCDEWESPLALRWLSNKEHKTPPVAGWPVDTFPLHKPNDANTN